VARPIGRLNSSSHSFLPYLDWSKVGQLLQHGPVSADPAAVSAPKGQSAQQQQQQQQQQPAAAARVLAQVQDCWMQAYHLQSGAVANKLRDRQHRRHLKKQQQQQQQLAPSSNDNQQQPKDSSGSSINPPSRKVMCRLRQQQHTDRQLQQWRQQHQQALLPAGYYIARSWRVAQAALPAAAASVDTLTQQQQQQAMGQPPPAAAGAAAEIRPQMLAGGQQHSKALQRALHAQQLAWVPVQAASSQAAAAAAAAAADAMEIDNAVAAAVGDAPVSAGQQAAAAASGLQSADPGSQQLQVTGGTCLVRVAVRVLGKGRCMQGAVLVAPAAEPFVTAGCDSGGSTGSSSSAGDTISVLGFVAAAVPRGAPAQLYPGGSGLCSVRGLWALRCKDTRPGSSRVLRAWLLNPGSTVLRRVELRLLLDV
jgi:hypothetical protein